jgi:hypothetical protein
MKRFALLPLVAFALAACSDAITNPAEDFTPPSPLFQLAAGPYGNVTTLNAAGTPSGGHFQQGTNTPVNCVVLVDLSVECSGNGPYEISGIGNSNAEAFLSAAWEATVDCTNKGGKLVPVKSQATGAPASTGEIEAKNGRLEVPVISVGAPAEAAFLAAATCPNGNWTKSLAEGDPTLVSFLYQLFFDGFTTPAISISAP